MRRCERCGRYIFYDSCPYCGLKTGNSSHNKASAGHASYFWIVIIVLGFIAFVVNPPSVIPVAGMSALVWAISRFGSGRHVGRQKKRE